MENTNRKKNFASSAMGQFLKSLMVLVILVILFAALSSPFRSVNNMINIALSVAIYGVLACGVSFVLISGGADISIGSTCGLCGVILGLLLQSGWGAVPAILATLVAGAILGALNGLMVTKMHLIAFIATLGTQYAYRGLTYILSGGSSISIRNSVRDETTLKFLQTMGSGKIFGSIPILIPVMFVFAIITGIILSKTTLGRRIYATGSNAEAARLSGISTDLIMTIAYAFSGLGAALAGVMLTTRLLSAQPTAGTSYELEGIAASVIGGVSMVGGSGNIAGAIVGAFVIGVMRNGLNILGVNSYVQQVVTGLIIIVAVYLDLLRHRREEAKK